MGIFGRRKVKVIDKPVEERTIPEIIESVEHVNPMNKDSVIKSWNERKKSKIFPKHMKGIASDMDSYWVNQNQQGHFNSANLSHQDFIDWANGTGRAVKGKTQEHKDKFMRGAYANMKHDLGLQIYIDHLWMIDSESKTKWNPRYRHSNYSNPINLSGRRDSAQVIKEVLSQIVQRLYRDIKDRWEWDGRYFEDDEERRGRDWLRTLKSNHREYMHGICHTLAIGGHGYYDACNTPCELENLAWSKDLPFAKAYALFLEDIDPGLVECMQWCSKNYYTDFDKEEINEEA